MTGDLVHITVEMIVEIRDHGRLASAVQLMLSGASDVEFYPTLPDKAAILGYSLAHDHGFADGNKRTAFQAMELFLLFNSAQITCEPESAEEVMVRVASGQMTRHEFTAWVVDHIDVLPPEITIP